MSMREGWKIVKLKNICDKASSNVAQKDLENNNGEYPIYGASGLIKKVDFFHYDKRYIGIVKDGSGVGRVNIYPANSSLLGTLQYILPKNGYELGFVYYALQSLNLSKYKVGAAIPHIYFRDYGEKELSVPPLEEQHRIVGILDAAFAKIDALKANAEANLANAKALFQQVLAQELKPKEGWVEKKLGEVCNNISYGTSLPSSENGIYKYLRMNNITLDGTLDLNNLKYITVPDKELAKCMVEKGDLLFNRTNSHELVGKSCVFENDEKMVIAGYIIRIRLNKEIAPKFANYYINLQRRLGYLKPLIVGAVHQANISAKSIQTINFVYPSLEEQHRIVQTLDTLSEKCRRLEQVAQQTIRECDALKQSILRKAFSGEL